MHRDLKPSNVLVTDDGLRVIDFGIVRAVSDSDELTRTGWLVGSPAFMSPEQADGATVGPASDVFSLGSVVVAAATGASPFVGTTTLHTLTNIVRHDPDLSGVPDAVHRIVEPCLAKKPADRPAPAELLASVGQITPAVQPWPEPVHQLIVRRQAEVAQFLHPGHDATVLVTGPPPRSTRVEDLHRSRRSVRAAAMVVVLALTGLLVWAVWPSPDPTTPDRALPDSSAPPPPPFEQVGIDMTGTSPIEALMFSQDSTVVTARFDDRTVQSWDVTSRRQRGQILGSFGGERRAQTGRRHRRKAAGPHLHQRRWHAGDSDPPVRQDNRGHGHGGAVVGHRQPQPAASTTHPREPVHRDERAQSRRPVSRHRRTGK